MKQPNIVIVDYDMGNLFSVKHACQHVGIKAKITTDPTVVAKADAMIVPGMGAFCDAINNLKKTGLSEVITKKVKAGTPYMGVCLGLQLLFDVSHEFGSYPGLGLLAGEVVRFPEKNALGRVIRTPQIGWNTIYPAKTSLGWEQTPYAHLKSGEFMYFVHSYFPVPADPQVVLSLTRYSGHEYCSAVIKDNIFAVQYHPEKSGVMGVGMYREWFKYVQRVVG